MCTGGTQRSIALSRFIELFATHTAAILLCGRIRIFIADGPRYNYVGVCACVQQHPRGGEVIVQACKVQWRLTSLLYMR